MSKRAGTAVIRAHRLDTAKPNRYTYITPWAKVSSLLNNLIPTFRLGLVSTTRLRTLPSMPMATMT